MSKNIAIGVLILALGFMWSAWNSAARINSELKADALVDAAEFRAMEQSRDDWARSSTKYQKLFEQKVRFADEMHHGYHAILYPMNIYTSINYFTGEVKILDAEPPSHDPLRFYPAKPKEPKPDPPVKTPPGDCREIINKTAGN